MSLRRKRPKISGILEQFAELVAVKLAAQLQNGHNSPFKPRLLTVEQAGVYIGRTREAVQSLVATGKLLTVRSDRRVFLDVKDLDRWIDEHKEEYGDKPWGKISVWAQFYPRGRRWWIEFYFRGQLIRESSGSTVKEDAERFLKKRMGEIASGQFHGLAPERIRIENLVADIVEDYALHERKSAPQLRSRLKHLKKLGEIRAADFNTEHIRRYIAERQNKGPATPPSTVNFRS